MKKKKKKVSDLFTKEEKKHIKEKCALMMDSLELLLAEYLLAEEEIRILKDHFKLSDREFAKIIQSYEHK